MEGKRIIATHRQAGAVTLLGDYWTTKGAFLRMKNDPASGISLESIESILHYLETHTELPKQNFWKALSHGQKINASKTFVIRECTAIDKETDLIFQNYSRRPELFISLNGPVTIVRE